MVRLCLDDVFSVCIYLLLNLERSLVLLGLDNVCLEKSVGCFSVKLFERTGDFLRSYELGFDHDDRVGLFACVLKVLNMSK